MLHRWSRQRRQQTDAEDQDCTAWKGGGVDGQEHHDAQGHQGSH